MVSRTSQAFIPVQQHRKIFQEHLKSSSRPSVDMPSADEYKPLRIIISLAKSSGLKTSSLMLQKRLIDFLEQVCILSHVSGSGSLSLC